jgi:hypothetical protein
VRVSCSCSSPSRARGSVGTDREHGLLCNREHGLPAAGSV